MRTERAELYFRKGSSDKVYHLQLETADGQSCVQAQWGRRGSALQSDTKVSNATYEEAKRVYDRVLREKTGNGYQIAQATADGSAAISVGLPTNKEHSGHIPPNYLRLSRSRTRNAKTLRPFTRFTVHQVLSIELGWKLIHQ